MVAAAAAARARHPGYRGEWHTFRQYVRNVAPAAARDLWVLFEPDLLPGYFWSFPVGDGDANVGFGIVRGGSIVTRDMKQLWPDLLARPHIRALLGPDVEPEGTHRAWPIPPASTTSCWPTAGCCSSATPPRPPTR